MCNEEQITLLHNIYDDYYFQEILYLIGKRCVKNIKQLISYG